MKNADDKNAIPGDKYGKMLFIFHGNWRNSNWSIFPVTSKFLMNQFDQKPYISISKAANIPCHAALLL